MKKLFFAILVFPFISQASLYCENFDLATGDIFGSITAKLPLEDLKNGIELKAEHYLVSSNFYLSWDESTKSFYFKIYSKEASSESTSAFTIPENLFAKNFRLGFNSIELTGLGDNVHARCDWRLK